MDAHVHEPRDIPVRQKKKGQQISASIEAIKNIKIKLNDEKG